ncbi:MAG: hypothetical protein K0B10_01160 [Vicingaceae bacterium]|nr:hypothetical protein [Vicingaceae bacterium]
MKQLFIILLLSLFAKSIFSQSTEVVPYYQVINIGNVVDIKNKTAYAAALKTLIAQEKLPTLLILNGDLTQKNGSAFLKNDSLPLYDFLNELSGIPNTQTIVVAGDRDWDNSGKKGIKKVKHLENLVEYKGFKNIKWVLDKGCPGPELIELDSNLLLMVINTQWWNHPYKKPEVVNANCDINTPKDFIIEVENALAETEDKNLIIAGHFPLVEQGNLPFINHLFPPVYGSFKTYYHQNIGGKRDIINANFNPIREKILNRMSVKSGVIYFSAHEYNTQIIKDFDNYFINNGLPESSKKARKTRFAVYSTSKPSITKVNYHVDGSVVGLNYLYKNEKFVLDKSVMLYKSLLDSSNDDIPENHANKSCLKDVSSTSFPENESIALVNAGNYDASRFRKFIIGKHYRKSWNTFVEVPILNMDTTKKGLVAYDKGGGHQTTSVKMVGNDGFAYTFRSVNKDATRGLSAELKHSLLARQLQDNVSMQHPYGGLIVSKLLDNTTILHAQPDLFVLPSHPKLGIYNKHSGMLGTLEDHQKNPKKVTHAFANADYLLQSYELNKKRYDKQNHTIDAKEYTKARVFDILVGDHGKHQDNWKWAGYKTDTGVFYRPIPRDRDLVFVQWDGIIPWLLDRKWMLEAGENFGYKINDVKSLMFVATPQDRLLTNEMTRKDWLEASAYIQHSLNDSLIDIAAQTLPKEIYELSGKTIAEKLKTRIKNLDKYAEEYYQFLAKQVDVVGTNEKEFFEITRNPSGTVDVSLFNVEEEQKGMKQLYHRTFFPSETKEIRLYGLGSKDIFVLKGKAKKSIPIIIVGGKGNDVILDSSSVKTPGKQTFIYEKSNNENSFLGAEAKHIDTWNDDLYDFQPTKFKYNRYLPLFSLNYNVDNGFGTSAGVIFTKREHYKNTDYTAKHKFNLEVTTEQNNSFEYSSKFRNVLHKWDFTVGGLLANHNKLTNFYGLGNNTVNDDSLSAANYYKTTYNTYSAHIGLVRDFRKKSSFYISTQYEYNSAQISDNTLFTATDENSSSLIFGTKGNDIIVSTAGLDLDFRDRSNLPESGVRLVSEYQNGQVVSEKTDYHIFKGHIEHYLTARIPTPITLATKAGGSISEGNIPFYNMVYLGSNNNLRGFRRNRFTGKSTLFLNNELRIQLANFTTSFLPMKMGIKVFFDTGRIYDDLDVTNKWHSAYGGGIYWGFLDEQFTFNLSVAHSDEENVFVLFSLGKSFN